MLNGMSRPRNWAVLLVVMGITRGALGGTIIHVDPRAPGNNNGIDWANAHTALQNAIARAQAGDEIRVAQGVYKPDVGTATVRRTTTPKSVGSGNPTASFYLRDGVVIKGGYAGYGRPDPDARNVDAYPSILSGDLSGNDVALKDLQIETLVEYIEDPTFSDNSQTVVMAMGVSSETVLDGFTITAGRYEVGRSSIVSGGLADGAGVLVYSANPTFNRCTFYRNTARSVDGRLAGGAGVACSDSQAVFRKCTFKENIAFGDGAYSLGAGILNYGGSPQLIDCTFTGNVAVGSEGKQYGGAVANVASDCAITGCTFVENRADLGGAVYSDQACAPSLTQCTFLRNEAANLGSGGAVYSSEDSRTSITSCRFLGNTAAKSGGAVCGWEFPLIANSAFSGNSARTGGALCVVESGLANILNCTFTANQASERGGAYYSYAGAADFTNCILWENTPEEFESPEGTASSSYSAIQGYPRLSDGNIRDDPRLQDPLGRDGVAGTLDDDLRLSVGSPCLDAGSVVALPVSLTHDLDGAARVTGARVDMGAYEFDGPYNLYVDALAGDDAAEGHNRLHAFATITRGIAAAEDGYTVVVLPGLYTEEVNFAGKEIAVAGAKGGVVLEAPGGYGISFYAAERSTSILKNLVIRNCDVGIFIAGASPTIQNVTLTDNEFGIAAYAGAGPDISNCILWGNIDGDLFGCTARYSCIESRANSQGDGNIRQDPLFADPENGDYHLISQRGRFVPDFGLWAFDERTSPCVDTGDPLLDPGAERTPNGGRINMGAFGGTPEASLSMWPLIDDLNGDGVIDSLDLDILYAEWLDMLPGADSDPSGVNPLQPNPARWAIDGQPREVGDGGAFDYYAEMTVGQVVSPNGPVEYFFECDQSDFSSDWQTQRTYIVLIGRTGQGLRFRVRARDQSDHMTDWSDWATAAPGVVRR